MMDSCVEIKDLCEQVEAIWDIENFYDWAASLCDGKSKQVEVAIPNTDGQTIGLNFELSDDCLQFFFRAGKAKQWMCKLHIQISCQKEKKWEYLVRSCLADNASHVTVMDPDELCHNKMALKNKPIRFHIVLSKRKIEYSETTTSVVRGSTYADIENLRTAMGIVQKENKNLKEMISTMQKENDFLREWMNTHLQNVSTSLTTPLAK